PRGAVAASGRNRLAPWGLPKRGRDIQRRRLFLSEMNRRILSAQLLGVVIRVGVRFPEDHVVPPKLRCLHLACLRIRPTPQDRLGLFFSEAFVKSVAVIAVSWFVELR